MVDERAEILVSVCSLFELKSAVSVASHHSHILKMTRTALVAYCAIMRMICHQPFDHVFAKLHRFFIFYGDPLVICHRFHTRHYQPAFAVVFIFVDLYGTLTASAN